MGSTCKVVWDSYRGERVLVEANMIPEDCWFIGREASRDGVSDVHPVELYFKNDENTLYNYSRNHNMYSLDDLSFTDYEKVDVEILVKRRYRSCEEG